jgi:hypothetical protein
VSKQGRWVKVYVKTLWDSKLRDLTCTQKWIFVTLILLADNNSGFLLGEDASPSYIGLAAGTDARIVRNSLVKIAEKSLIITHDNGDIEIRNWYKYQSTTAKRDQYREGQNALLDKNREDKNREDNIYSVDTEKVLLDFNELGPGPKHENLSDKAIDIIIKLCTDGDASGEIWDNEKFTAAFKIYGDMYRSGRWSYKWPSITDLLSRTLYQKSGPGLLRFLKREGYDPEKEIGFNDKKKSKRTYEQGL